MTLADLSDQILPFPDADNLLSTDTNNHHRTTSSPLRKLRPIRSHATSTTTVAGGGDSPKLCSRSSRGTSSSTTTTASPPSDEADGGDDSMDMVMDANPNKELELLWAKTLEQLGQEQKIDDNYFKQLLNQRNGNEDKLLLPAIPLMVESSANNNSTTSTLPDPVDIANMLVSLHTTSAPDTSKGEEERNILNGKRKRKTFNELELFLFNMVEQVTKQQDEMHKQMMQMIDKYDRDRIAREEAWRLQEVERQRKDKEMRDQQTSRNLALISFIEGYLGQQFHFPVSLPVPDELRYDQASETQEYKLDLSTRRWPQSEVKSLISIRIAMDHKFKNADIKHNIWEEVSQTMCSMGYNRNAKKCKEKWENINKYFKKTVASGRRPKSNKTCPYFDELDVLYRTRVLSPGSALVEVKNEGNKEIEAEEPQSL